MTLQASVDVAQRAIEVAILVAGPILLASLVTGLAVSLLQAVTSIQEATLTIVPKLVVVFVVLLFCLPWMLDLLVGFSADLFGGLERGAR
jgi:flagellar biosynthetic protein FliQ